MPDDLAETRRESSPLVVPGQHSQHSSQTRCQPQAVILCVLRLAVYFSENNMSKEVMP